MVLLAGLSLLTLAACSRPAPEARLRADISAMQAAIQDRQPGEVMDRVADDFSGDGGMDREALHNLLRVQFLANADIGATIGPLDVTLRGDHATVRFSALLTGGSGRWVPDQAGGYQVITGWRLEEGDWKLYTAQWSR
ncbi:nuclear transport factor 2 family protein [Pseudoxanthomonas sp.]|uniref:nuclear transport factor 2 family protein n=1 Tax=Pseudoxanthomonas sp. TaxID=1871049 RepID=UPI00260C73E6|nr:nuclear transport factor 2 family protein [Pseudoxanthomonas sp.]WDS36799.1 MAG: nuclear transport factor 2 family protein [Pseudoxanthomonas sp.]